MTTQSAAAAASLTEQTPVDEMPSMELIPELFIYVSLHLTHVELMKLARLSPSFRRLFNEQTWRFVVTSDQESENARARKKRSILKCDQVADMTITRKMRSQIEFKRYVPESILKNPGKYSWVKSEHILSIEMYKCSNLDKELFSAAELKPYCNIQNISIHVVSVIVKEPECFYVIPIHADSFHTELENMLEGPSGTEVNYDIMPNNRILRYSNNRLCSDTYETVITNTNYTVLKDYRSVVGLTAYYIDATQKLLDIWIKIDLFVNLKRLTFYPSVRLSLPAYEQFMKALNRLPCLQDLKTSHIIHPLHQTYTACRYAPRHLKSYEIMVSILESKINIQQINSITGPIPQVTSMLLNFAYSQPYHQTYIDTYALLDILPMLTSLRKLLFSGVSFLPDTSTLTIPHASKLASLTIEAKDNQCLFLFMESLHQLNNLKALSVKDFTNKNYCRHARASKRRLMNPVFQSLQQFIRKLNRGEISLDDIDEAKLDYCNLWNQLEESTKAKRLSWGEKDLKNVFGALLFPKTLLQKTHTHMKWVLDKSYKYIDRVIEKSLGYDLHDDGNDNYRIIYYQAICEAFCEEIFKLPKIQYVQITGYQIALEAPRFQELLKHPTLETIEVTEDVSRATKMLNELWYAGHLTKVDSQKFHHIKFIPTLCKTSNTYEVDVESIRKGYCGNNYDGFSQSGGRECGLGLRDLAICRRLIQAPSAGI